MVIDNPRLASIIKDADGDTKVDVEESADEDKIHMDVDGVEAFLLQDDGVLDLAKQSGCAVSRSAAPQTIPDATPTKIEFNAEYFDIQNEFDSTTNYRFTAKKAGRYLLTSIISLAALVDGQRLIIYLNKNGVGVGSLSTTTGAAADGGTTATTVVEMAANDYLEVFCYQNAGVAKSTVALADTTTLAVMKVS